MGGGRGGVRSTIVMSCHVMSFQGVADIMSCRVMPSKYISGHVTPLKHVMLRHVVSLKYVMCHVMSLKFLMSRHAMSCHCMSHYVLCHVLQDVLIRGPLETFLRGGTGIPLFAQLDFNASLHTNTDHFPRWSRLGLVLGFKGKPI